jgi:hypothetical protein
MQTVSVEPPKTFTHHRGKDEGYDSVCLTCFRPVASARRERDLSRLERKHECSPYDLAFQPKFGPH